ncbi:MAG: esterase family protein [Deltaproteobacteria bacterium]|nr:esterase family protein [Deltaproteobacteria bacterium]
MRKISIAIFLAALAASGAQGQLPGNKQPGLEAGQETPITIGKRIEFRSAILSDTVSMNIYLPDGFEVSSREHTYPVIFINGGHGNRFFPTLAGMVKLLSERERIPESIVVSLNDMGDIPLIYTHGMWGAKTLGGSGDPQLSVQHLEKEVIPFLEKNYRANSYRLIIGVSGSSLFPIYTFTHAPDLFRSHILVAAADMIGMGYAQDKTFLDAFEEALAEAPKRRAKLYLGVADSDIQKRLDYQTNLDELERRFGQSTALDLRVEVVPKADHYEVFIKAVQSALEQNFPHELWASRYRDLVAEPGDALENIDKYYRELSKRVGFDVLPRADRWNSVNCLRFITRHLIALDRTEEAVAVAQRRVQYQPTVAASFSGLADAYEANHQLKEAAEALEQEIRLAKALPVTDDRTRAIRSTTLTAAEERLRSLKEKIAEQG